jgi:methyl-accepting chemotaxis protein
VSQNEGASAAKNSLLISIVIVLLGMVALFVFFVRAITQLPKVVAELASGDLSQSFEITRKDEVGQIMTAMKGMRDRLLDMVTRIRDASQQVTISAGDMKNLSSDTVAQMQSLSNETSQSAHAISELSQTARNVAQNIVKTAEAAQDVNDETISGNQIVEQTISRIKQLAGQVETAADAIRKLEQDTESIGSVLSVIHGVAEQTNLLALNAAIEAARAGEQGRGFAVVADEVRTLAGRTQSSTQEIHNIIEQFKSSSNEAVQVMNDSQELANGAVEQAVTAGESLSSIAAAVARISEMSSAIATTAEEQEAVALEASRNISNINDMAKQATENTNRTYQTSQELDQVTHGLQETISQFKT